MAISKLSKVIIGQQVESGDFAFVKTASGKVASVDTKAHLPMTKEIQNRNEKNLGARFHKNAGAQRGKKGPSPDRTM